MSKLLSVCIPAYTKSTFLNELLLELCSQLIHVNEFSPCQVDICISDDSPNDSNQKVVRSFQEKYDFIHYAKNEKPGFVLNLENLGKLSTSKFVWFLSEDDQVLPLGLQKLVQYLLEYDGEDNLNAVILARSILEADTGHIYDEEYGDDLVETKLFCCSSPILQYFNYGDLNVLARLIIRRQFVNGNSWSTRDDFAFFPQLTGLLEAISQGKHLWIGERLVLYRYVGNNPNWIASSAIGFAIEFPSYNSLATSLGIPDKYLQNTYSKKSAIYSYLKIRFFREEYGDRLGKIAEERLNSDIPNFKLLKLCTDLLLETLRLRKLLYPIFVMVRPGSLLEAKVAKQHLQGLGKI